jgi:SAM-dependent methyltransferase
MTVTQALAPTHYSFGDNHLAGTRLSLLAETYEPSSFALLSDYAPNQVTLAVDLGSGLGHTAALLARLNAFARVVGYERSTNHIAKAQASYPNLQFIEQDVLNLPYAHSNVDLAYSRFLLTHLNAPERALLNFLGLLRPGGRLILEEIAHLSSPLESIQKYYMLVHELQAHYGQELYIGRKLDGFARRSGMRIVHSHQRSFPLSAQRMARLHAMNLLTWMKDPYMSQAHPREEFELLLLALESLAESKQTLAPVTCTMAQLVIET